MRSSRFVRAYATRVATVLITAGLLVIGLGAVATADHVPPTVMSGNPKCADLSDDWNELKVNKAPNGTHDDTGGGDNPGGPGPLVFTVENSDGKTFDWESNEVGVDAVIVKGGNRGANVYRYDPEATADQRLQSPLNSSGNLPQISHISACYDAADSGDGGGGDQGGGDQGGDDQGGDDQQQGGGDEGGDDQQGGERPGGGDQQGDGQGGGDQRDDDQGDARRPADGEEDGGDGEGDVRGERESSPRDGGDNDRSGDEGEADGDGEGGVRGVSETDEGEDDVEEETVSDDDDESDDDDDEELPFSGLPLMGLFLIGLGLIMVGTAGRAGVRD